MPSLIELLHQAQRELTCPTCSRSFLISEIRPRVHINNTLMLQAVCTNNHFPIVLIFIPSQPFKTKMKPFTKTEAAKLTKALETFDGNFASVWPNATKDS